MKKIYQLLVRKTNSTVFVPEIDALRFFAILTVMFFHLNATLTSHWGLDRIEDSYMLLGGGDSLLDFGWWLRRMDLGVRVFFAISGMVLAMPYIKRYMAKEPFEPIYRFYGRRLLRLEPLFILSLIFFSFIYVLVLDKPVGDALHYFLASLTYSNVLVFGFPSPINPVTWSLETEFQFYLLFPFIFAFIFAYENRYWITLSFILMIVATLFFRNLLYFDNNPHFNQSILFYISNFTTGILFAWIWIRHQSLFVRKRYLWDLTTILSIVGLFYFYKPQDDWTLNLFFNFSIFGLFFGVFKGQLFHKISNFDGIVLIGGMCYSLYLFHLGALHFFVPLVLDFIGKVSYAHALLILSLSALPLAILTGMMVYITVEKPTMDARWPRKLLYFLSGNSHLKRPDESS